MSSTDNTLSKIGATLRTFSYETSEDPLSQLTENVKKLEPYLNQERVTLCGEFMNTLDVWALCLLLQNSRYSHVKALSLRGNNLKDECAKPLAELLEKNSSLLELDLSENYFSAQTLCLLNIGAAQGNCNLRTLVLEDNLNIEAQGFGFLTEMMGICQSLTHLNLSGLYLQKEAMAKFVLGLRESDSVKELILENTHLTQESARMFMKELCDKDCKLRLEWLSLDYNPDPHFSLFAPLFSHPNFKSLQKLSLSFLFNGREHRGRDNPANSIYTKLLGNRTLKELYLKGNNFQANSCHALSAMIMLPTKIKVLDLSDNNIDFKGLTFLRAAIEKNKHLRTLKFNDNRFFDNPEGVKLHEEIQDILRAKERINPSVPTITSKLKRASGASPDDGRKSRNSDDLSDSTFSSSKIKKKRAFARKKQPFVKRYSPENFTNLDSDEQSVQFDTPKKLRKFANRIKVHLKKPKVNVDDDSDPKVGSWNDNLNDDYSSMKMEEGGHKNLRNFALKKKPLRRPKHTIKKKSDFNNLNNDEETCIIMTDELKRNREPSFEDSVIFEEEEDDFVSVIYDDKKKEEGQDESERFGQKKSVFSVTPSFIGSHHSMVKGLFDDKIESSDDDNLERATDPGHPGWDMLKLAKSELGFINHMQSMLNRRETPGEESSSVIKVSKDELGTLEDMLSEFENLLDRDELVKTVGRNASLNGKKRFIRMFGIVGELKKQKKGKVINYHWAKKKIHDTLIKQDLAKNVVLVSMYQKFRRELGSGVETRIGSILPSKLLECLLPSKENPSHVPKLPTIDVLENYYQSLLLTRVVVWSCFKALAITKPEVDPQGRHLLEEFGKAMVEKEKRANKDIKEEDQKSKLGLYILKGVFFELMDVLMLLKPMYAVAEMLFLTVKTDNPQPPLGHYDLVYSKGDKRATNKIKKRLMKIHKNKAAKELAKTFRKVQEASKERDRETVRSTRSVERLKSNESKKNVLDDVLKRVEIGKEKEKIKKKTSVSPSVKNTKNKNKKGLVVTTKILRYRENCPERVQNLLAELKFEAESLMTMLSIKDFLPTLLSFCDYKDVPDHYKEKSELLIKQLSVWTKKMTQEFENKILHHVQPAVVPDVEPTVKTRAKFMVRNPKPIVKETVPEFQTVFLRIKKQAEVLPTPKSTYESSGSKSKEPSFYDPLINQLFSSKQMTEAAANKVKEIATKRFNDVHRVKRSIFIDHLLSLCGKGCEETISMKMLNATLEVSNLHPTSEQKVKT